MDDLLRDPELAPHVVKLLNDKLQEARKALQASKTEAETCRTEIKRLQELQANAENRGDVEKDRLKQDLQNALHEKDRLQAENADLHGLFEGFRRREEEAATNLVVEPEETKPDIHSCGTSCPSRDTVLHLEETVAELRGQLETRNTAAMDLQQHVRSLEMQLETSESSCERYITQVRDMQAQADARATAYQELQARVVELQNQLANSQASVGDLENRLADLQERFNTLQQQHKTMQTEFDQREVRLRQELEIETNKHWRYKQTFLDCQAALEQLQAQRRSSLPNVTSAVSNQGRDSDAGPATQNVPVKNSEASKIPEPWWHVVKYVLSHPCFPLSLPSAPFLLPLEIKKLMGAATVLSCPNRILYPYDENIARLLAPQAYCVPSASPIEMGDATHSLQRLVGATKEMFYHSDTAVCYAGTFLCINVGEVSKEEYHALPKHMREAIVKHTFPSKAAYEAADKMELDRLRNYYISGRAKVQYLELRYQGYNKPLAAALAAFGEQLVRDPTIGQKRAASTQNEETQAKRARTLL